MEAVCGRPVAFFTRKHFHSLCRFNATHVLPNACLLVQGVATRTQHAKLVEFWITKMPILYISYFSKCTQFKVGRYCRHSVSYRISVTHFGTAHLFTPLVWMLWHESEMNTRRLKCNLMNLSQFLSVRFHISRNVGQQSSRLGSHFSLSWTTLRSPPPHSVSSSYFN